MGGIWGIRSVVIAAFCHIALIGMAAGGDSFKPAPFESIPGLTMEELTRIHSLRQARPSGLVYGIMHSDETFIDQNGEVGGFTKLLCDHLSEMFGIPVRPDVVGWDELVDGLDGHGIDLSGELTATAERREKYFMSTPIAERTFTVYRNSAVPEFDLINDTGALRYGFLEDSITYQRVQETSERDFVPVFFENYRQAAEAMRDGTIDLFISESMMDSAFEEYPDICFQKYLPVAFTSVSLGTGNPDLVPLIDVFQKYLDNGGDARMEALRHQGNIDYIRYKLSRQLTGEERDFLKKVAESGQLIPIGAEFDNYPASFFNQRENTWQGISLDLLSEIGSITGLNFSIVNQPGDRWNAIYDKLLRGEIHMITQLLKSKNRDGMFIWSSVPYMHDQYALLSRAGADDVAVNKIRHARVGLIGGTAYEEVFHRIIPGQENTVVYPDTIAAFDGLRKRDVDLVMMTSNLLLSATHFMESPDFRVNVSLGVPCNSYFGFNKEQQVLASIVDKAQALIDPSIHAERWKRKVFDYRKKVAEARTPYLVTFALLLMAIIFLVDKQYRTRVQATQKLSVTDHLTQLPNRRFFDSRLAEAWAQAVENRTPLGLLIMDIDHFKQFNDTYGHQMGDEVLATIGKVLKDSIHRKGDLAARVGGEEFAVVLPNTNDSGAADMAEKICRTIERTVVPGPGGIDLRATVSIGIAVAVPKPSDSLEDFLRRSDGGLYKAKECGRNRCCQLPVGLPGIANG